jgi:hypothetical protein
LNTPGGADEREADRVAGQVLAKPANPVLGGALPRIERHAARSSGQLAAVPPGVGRALEDPGKPLEAPLRLEMEQRFGHDFSRVRVHVGAAAEHSARELNASAYTIGRDVVFGAGRFEPRTQHGQRLIAHELTHVVQQSAPDRRGVGQGNGSHPALIQRQPDDGSEKKAPVQKQFSKKTLKSEKVDATDRIGKGTAAIIDEVLARNQRLAPYIGDRLSGGFKVAEKGKFILESTDGNFDDAYRKAYDLDSSKMVSKDTKGFLDPRSAAIHVRPTAQFGTALHEAVHRLASPSLYSSYLRTKGISSDVVDVLKEGLTAFFTDSILNDEGLPDFNDAYRNQKKKTAALISALGPHGFNLIATLNFKGTNIIQIGEQLGFTEKEFNAAPGNGVREVLKRMGQQM